MLQVAFQSILMTQSHGSKPQAMWHSSLSGKEGQGKMRRREDEEKGR